MQIVGIGNEKHEQLLYGSNGASHALLKLFPHSLLGFGMYLLPAWTSQT